jgi:capsular polysaccharide biosynthesis protein
MSPDSEPRSAQPELDVEQEVDFGRYVGAIVSRWWLILAGGVAGAIIGFLVTLGGNTEYKATAQVYLGQPLAPGAGGSVSTVPTQLGLVTRLLQGEATVRRAAAEAGLKPSRLRGHVTTEPIVGITGAKVGTPAPLVDITVTGASPGKTALAANALAGIAVTASSTYQDEKIAQIKERFAFVDRELQKVNRNLARVEQQLDALLAAKEIGTAERLFALTTLNSRLNFNQARQSSLEQERFTMRQLLKLAEDIERARVVAPAVATRTEGPSKRTGAVIGLLIGLVAGVLAAVLWEPVSARLHPQPA